MRVLGLETTGAACSAALAGPSGALAHRSEAMRRGHAEALIPMVDALLSEAGQSFQTLDGVAVTRGPGSFTSARVGLAAARAFALAHGLPVMAVSSLALLAECAADAVQAPVLVAAIDARRGMLYRQVFRRTGAGGLMAHDDPVEAAPSVLPDLPSAATVDAPACVIGDAAGALLQQAASARLIAGPDVTPGARELAVLAAAGRLAAHQAAPSPLYIRAPDADRPQPSVFQ